MRKVLVCFMFILTFCQFNLLLALEPIGTIGHQLPKKHVFLSNSKLLRVFQTHIEIVDVDTTEMEDVFGDFTENSEVAFSPTASHIAILDFSWKDKKTIVHIWDMNAREIVSNWEFESEVTSYGAFSPIDPLFATVSKRNIELWNWQTGEHIGTMIGTRRPLESCYVRENARLMGFRGQTLLTEHLRVGYTYINMHKEHPERIITSYMGTVPNTPPETITIVFRDDSSEDNHTRAYTDFYGYNPNFHLFELWEVFTNPAPSYRTIWKNVLQRLKIPLILEIYKSSKSWFRQTTVGTVFPRPPLTL